MIDFKKVYTVFKKEFTLYFRDKSIILTNIFIPLFGIPFTLILMAQIASYQENKREQAKTNKTKEYIISYQGTPLLETLDLLKEDKKIKLIDDKSVIDQNLITDYRKKFKAYLDYKRENPTLKLDIENKIDVKKIKQETKKLKKDYLLAKKQIQDKFDQDQVDLHIAFFESADNTIATYLFYSENSKKSEKSFKYLNKLFKKFNKDAKQNFLTKVNASTGDFNKYSIWNVDMTTDDENPYKSIGFALGGFILVLLVTGVYYPTLSATIGERDDKTSHVLLMNPITISEIFLGKYLNTAFQGMIQLVPYFFEICFLYAWYEGEGGVDVQSFFTAYNLSLFFMATVSISLFCTAISFLISSFSKTKNQAQALLTLLLFFITIPIGVVFNLDLVLNSFTAMVPLINFPLVINAIINGKIEFLHFFLAVILNISVSALIIIMSQNAFTTQWKGKSDTLGVSDLLSRGKNKSKSITPAHAFLGFVMAFLGYGYGSLIIYALKAKVLLFWFSPILFSLIPAILMLQLSKLEISRAFKWESALNTYSIRAGLGAIMLNCFFIGLAILWFPTAGEQNTEELFSIFDKTTLLGMMSFYGIFAVLPAICEEFLFRGVVFQGFRKQYNFLTSMVVSAFLFSVIHFSLFKLPHTFVAGLILAYIYEKKGMVTAILFHFCFNATGVTMALKFGHLFQEMPDNKLLITLLLCVSAIASFWLIRIKSPRSNDNTKNELQDDSQAAA